MQTEPDYYDLSTSQTAAILVLMFILGVAAGYLIFHC